MAQGFLCCGAECGVSDASGVTRHLNFRGTSPTFDTTTVRTGLRALNCKATLGSSFAITPTVSSTLYVGRFYVRFVILPTLTCTIVEGRGASNVGVYYKASDSKLYAGYGLSNLGATGVAVTTGVWYRVDFKFNVSTNPWTIDAMINGVAVGQITKAAATGGISNLDLGIGELSTPTHEVLYDDLLLSATVADYPLGAGYVFSYIPNADGSHNVAGANDFEKTLTGTDITNATTDAYQLVDDRPLPASSVDFINGIAPPNDTDYVEIAYENSQEARAPRLVDAMFIHHDAGGAGTNDFTVTLRDSVGGTSQDIFTGATNVGATISARRQFFQDIPGGGTWTLGAFNALRSRFLVTDASPDVYLDALMLEAEYATTADARLQVASPMGLGISSQRVNLTPSANYFMGVM